MEVLAALALAALAVSVTGQIALQAVEARQSVLRSIHDLQREVVVFESLAANFAHLLPAGDEPTVMIFGTPQQVLQLHVLAPVQHDSPSLHVAYRPATVRYRLVRHDSRHDWELVQEITDETAADASIVRETLARQVTSFQLEALDKIQWVRQWPEKAKAADLRAVRVSLAWADGKTAKTRAFLLGSLEP